MFVCLHHLCLCLDVALQAESAVKGGIYVLKETINAFLKSSQISLRLQHIFWAK